MSQIIQDIRAYNDYAEQIIAELKEKKRTNFFENAIITDKSGFIARTKQIITILNELQKIVKNNGLYETMGLDYDEIINDMNDLEQYLVTENKGQHIKPPSPPQLYTNPLDKITPTAYNLAEAVSTMASDDQNPHITNTFGGGDDIYELSGNEFSEE